jgi:hypothetical protein
MEVIARSAERQIFAPITPDDHAGYIWIVVIYTLIFSILACACRLWIKREKIGADDWLYCAATVSEAAQWPWQHELISL